MRHLVRVELDRIRWRRAVRVLVPIALLMPVVMLVIWTANTKPHDAQAWARAEARAQREMSSPGFQHQIDRCVADQWIGPGTTREQCIAEQAPRPDWYLPYNEMKAQDAITGFAPAAAMLVVGAIALAAMTYAGADWSSGSISNQLIFNPRRLQLYAAKLIAIGALGAVVSLLVQAVWWIAFTLIAQVRDLPWEPGMTGDALAVAAKGTAFAALIGVTAFALTTLVRHTVAALGTTLAVLAVSTAFIHGLDTGNLQALSPALNAGATLFDDITYSTQSWSSGDGFRAYETHTIGAAQGFLFWGVIGLGLVLGGGAAFRRRDVP
ncbi:hypothetical protein GCM10028801_29340 [Nocardioides maradonensis]